MDHPMDHPEGAGSDRGDRVDFDHRVRLEFRSAQSSSDGGLLVMRELDDALGLSGLASSALRDNRRGKFTINRSAGVLLATRRSTTRGWGRAVDAQAALGPADGAVRDRGRWPRRRTGTRWPT